MRGSPAFVASALAHAAALVLVARWLEPGEAHAIVALDEPATPTERAMVELPAIEVLLVPADRVSAGDPVSGNAGGAGEVAVSRSRRSRIEGPPRRSEHASDAGSEHARNAGQVAIGASRNVEHASDTGQPLRGDHAGPLGTGGALGMRGRRHDLSLPGATIERVLRDTRPLPPAVTPTGLLEPTGRGAHAIDDEVVAIRVRPDGTVVMTDKPDFTIHLAIPIMSFDELRRGLGQLITEWLRDPYAAQRAGACDHSNPRCDSARLADDTGGGGGLPLFYGKADVTAYLMRELGGGDPYSSRKRKLLDDTRDERAQIGAAHRTAQLARSAELVQRNLDALWRTTADPAARRAALFALWDECAEGEGAAGQAGELARAMVIGWIRGHLPAGGPGAFTEDELARLDAARTSHRHFAPYAQ